MNSDCIVVMGSNMAENHPVGFQWALEARERGAHLFHVDPRFTRTSAMATKHVGIRAGSDIAFLGGIVHYILEHERWFHDYVVRYTNAPVIVDEGFSDTEENDGLFSGWDPETGEYDVTTWRRGSGSRASRARPRASSPATAATAAGCRTARRRRRTTRSSIRAASSRS
jgi:formate dehydrogenase major subunit